jgi:hypothetical protein
VTIRVDIVVFLVRENMAHSLSASRLMSEMKQVNPRFINHRPRAKDRPLLFDRRDCAPSVSGQNCLCRECGRWYLGAVRRSVGCGRALALAMFGGCWFVYLEARFSLTNLVAHQWKGGFDRRSDDEESESCQ